MTDEIDTDWITSAAGNRASITYFGSEDEARKALDSLKNCQNCTNCSDCSDCSGCSRCSDCSDCLDCSWQDNLKGEIADPANGPPPIPTIENIHAVVYAAASQPNSLKMNNWHSCEKTHCRAGWITTLAGPAGKKLEAFYNTELAAMLIYDASAPDFKINPARFYDDNDDALADMKRLAEAT